MFFILSLFTQFSHCDRSFKIVGDEFQMDGKPFRYISGEVHYFRVDPEYWEEVLKKVRNGGCNVVQTYVPWNIHEPKKGQYKFTGLYDVEQFVQIAQDLGLYVILRPGPYICAEWDLGGLPYFLLQEESITVRSSDPVFMSHVRSYYEELYRRLRPHMYHNGGNIIMVQIENEYGSYPQCDHDYLRQLCDITQDLLGEETQLFTTDGASESYLKCGSIVDRAYATVDFGTGDPTYAFELERRWNNGHGPYVNSEFYTGWLDHWGEKHHTVSTDAVVSSLDKMLSMGANVNMYMYIGGTNFHFYNGANGGASSYQPDLSSYDYDAPISEAADMTWKYEKIREVAKKYIDVPDIAVTNNTKKAYGTVTFTEGISLFDALDQIGNVRKTSERPISMEDLNVDYGFVLYHSQIKDGESLSIPHCKDRGYVFVNKKRQCIVQHAEEKKCKLIDSTGDLDILVENMGRLNYGAEFFEKKGITDTVKIDGEELNGWTMTGFNLTNLSNILTFTKELPTKVPAFYKGYFDVDEMADTFLNPSGWVRGTVILNNYTVGRYWNVGPQLTLYMPKFFVKKGRNELIVFDYESQFDKVPTMTFEDRHQIDIN